MKKAHKIFTREHARRMERKAQQAIDKYVLFKQLLEVCDERKMDNAEVRAFRSKVYKLGILLKNRGL